MPFQKVYSFPLYAAMDRPTFDQVDGICFCAAQLVPSKLLYQWVSSEPMPFHAAQSLPLKAASDGPTLDQVEGVVFCGAQVLPS